MDRETGCLVRSTVEPRSTRGVGQRVPVIRVDPIRMAVYDDRRMRMGAGDPDLDANAYPF